MRRFLKSLIISMILSIAVISTLSAEYDPKGPLRIKSVEFCIDRPKGLGRFKLRGDNEFKKGQDDVYIYIEIANCKPERVDQYYHVRLAMDIDIYYEDGMRIYSEEEANVFNYQTMRKNTDAYLWTKVDASYLKNGEYKVEMTIRDENSDKEAFALARFKRIEEPVWPAGRD